MMHGCFVHVFVFQDEVIGVSKKAVVRVEHLVKWTCPEPPQWKQNTTNITDLRVLNGSSCLTDPQEVKTKGDLQGCNGELVCVTLVRNLENQCCSLTVFFLSLLQMMFQEFSTGLRCSVTRSTAAFAPCRNGSRTTQPDPVRKTLTCWLWAG